MPVTWQDPHRYEQYLYLHAPTTIFAAQVDQASFTYPLAQVSFDTVTTGAYTDVQPGMTVVFGSQPGLSDRGRGRVRKDPTSSVLYIGWSSQGVRDGECNLADNAYITVWNDYRAWTKTPRLVDFEHQYKDYDLAYTEGADIPPLANGGPWVFKLVDSSNTISVDFAGVATALDPGATITTHAWDFADGTPSSAATASVSNVSFPAGDRWVHYTVTDSNGKTHTHHILVVAGSQMGTEVSYSGATYDENEEDAGHPTEDAFDDDLTSNWQTLDGTLTGWIEVTFPSEVTIAGYTLRDGSTMHIGKNPTEWTVQVGAGLTTVDTQTGITWSADETKTFVFNQPVTSTVFRLDMTANNGHGLNIGVVEWDLMTSDANYITNFEVTEQTLDREQGGQIFRVIVHDDIDEGTYPDGTAVMYMEREFYDGTEGSLDGPADREHMKFPGWLATDRNTLETGERGILTTTELECHDIAARMRNLPAYSNGVGRIGTSTAWYLLPSAHTDRYIHYLLHWHSTVLDVAPFTLSGTGGTYALTVFSTAAMTLWDQVLWRTRSIGYELTCSMQGELKMLPDPLQQDSGDRTSTIITDIDPTDWGGNPGAINFTTQRNPRTHWLWGSAVKASTAYVSQVGVKLDPLFSVAPGQAPGQGPAEQTKGEQLVADQDELNARTGHQYARMNAFQTVFDIQLKSVRDIDPARMEWVRLTIAAAQAGSRGLTFTDERFLPVRTSIVHERVSVGNDVTVTVKQITLTAERETSGPPGATHIPETGTVVPTTTNPDDWGWIFEDEPTYELHAGAQTIAAFENSGELHITTDFGTPEASGGPTWTTTDLTALSPALSGDFLAMVGDPFSPRFITKGATDPVNGWILTKTGIYSITDIFGVSGGPTLALQHTLATPGGAGALGFIGTGISVQNWVVATVYYDTATGTKAIYTTDGSTWTESTITAHYDSGANTHYPWSFVSSSQAGLVYAGAFPSTGSGVNGDLYYSTNYGSTWTQDTGAIDFGQSTGGTFHKPWHDNATQNITYYNQRATVGAGIGNKFYRLEADGTTATLISPASSYSGIGCRDWWWMSICPIDRQRIVATMVEERNPYALSDRLAIFTSKDAGDSWTQASAWDSIPAARWAIAGDNPDVIYGWSGNIIYSKDFMQNYENKNGNLTIGGEIINMVGG